MPNLRKNPSICHMVIAKKSTAYAKFAKKSQN